MARASGYAAARRAFTLIELLVVVAIIALLISILLPSLQRARRQSRTVVCASNMRNLMFATTLYADENDSRFPTAGLTHGGQADDLERAWVVQLAKEYGKQDKCVRCPSDHSAYWKTPLPDGRIRRTSYASNSYTVFEIGDEPAFNRFSVIQRPAATIYWVELAEKGDFAGADHVHAEDWWFGESEKLAAREMELHQHLETKANYAFMDTHVDTLTFNKTYRIEPGSGFPPHFLINKYNPRLAQ